MGLLVRSNGVSGRSNRAVVSDNKQSAKVTSNPSNTSRKKWTLFILKHHVPCDDKQLQPSNCGTSFPNGIAVEAPLKPLRTLHSYLTGDEDDFEFEDVPLKNGKETADDFGQTKDRLKGLAAIVQDVLSRSLSDLQREYGGDQLKGDVTTSDISNVSFRMQLLDRCNTGLGSARLRCASSSSLVPSEADTSVGYSQRIAPENISRLEGLTDREKRDEANLTLYGTTRLPGPEEYETLVDRLSDPRSTIRLLAAATIREATRNSPQAREDLWRAGAIPPLINLLEEQDQSICYMATVALLNLAIGSVRNKQAMAECGAIPILVRLIRPESCTKVRESATTVILSLAASDQLKPGIGTSGAIVYLSDILSCGTTQGRSDAVRALLNLSIFKGNRPPIVQAGVVPPLYTVILQDAKETVEKAMILLTHLFMCKEGRETISTHENTVTVLIQVLKRASFSQSSKEQTVVILLALSSRTSVRREAVSAQGILPSLVEITLLGSNQRIQDKAGKLLKILKEHRSDEGVQSMERSSDLEDRRCLERQYSSSSTVETTISSYSTQTAKCSVSRTDSDKVQYASKYGKDIRYSKVFRSLISRSMRSDYLTCRAASLSDSSRLSSTCFGFQGGGLLNDNMTSTEECGVLKEMHQCKGWKDFQRKHRGALGELPAFTRSLITSHFKYT